MEISSTLQQKPEITFCRLFLLWLGFDAFVQTNILLMWNCVKLRTSLKQKLVDRNVFYVRVIISSISWPKCVLFRYHKFKQSHSTTSWRSDTVCTPASESSNSSLVLSFLPRWNVGRSYSHPSVRCAAEGSTVAATCYFTGK